MDIYWLFFRYFLHHICLLHLIDSDYPVFLGWLWYFTNQISCIQDILQEDAASESQWPYPRANDRSTFSQYSM